VGAGAPRVSAEPPPYLLCGSMTRTGQPDPLEQAINEMICQAVRKGDSDDATEPFDPSLSHKSITSLHEVSCVLHAGISRA
jgi:hypothetical protein